MIRKLNVMIDTGIGTEEKHCGKCRYLSVTQRYFCDLFYAFVGEDPSEWARTEILRAPVCVGAEIHAKV